jgi:hypothetical protein
MDLTPNVIDSCRVATSSDSLQIIPFNTFIGVGAVSPLTDYTELEIKTQQNFNLLYIKINVFTTTTRANPVVILTEMVSLDLSILHQNIELLKPLPLSQYALKTHSLNKILTNQFNFYIGGGGNFLFQGAGELPIMLKVGPGGSVKVGIKSNLDGINYQSEWWINGEMFGYFD